MSHAALHVVRHPPVVGMVGAGHIARMTHQAAGDLAVELVVLARTAWDPAVISGAHALFGPPDAIDGLEHLAQACDVVTFDHDGHVPSRLAVTLARQGYQVFPRGEALAVAQDRFYARRLLASTGFPVPAFTMVSKDARKEVERFAVKVGWPVVVKARSGVHDDRVVAILTSPKESQEFLEGAGHGTLWVEEYVEASRKVLMVGVRSPSGHWVGYPLAETRQPDGMYREVVMPAPVPPAVAEEAEAIAKSIADGIDAVGIVGVELFMAPDERLMVNKITLGPHELGYATIEASATSQFHNHLRAVLDWPLGVTSLRAPAAAMVNVRGSLDHADTLARLSEVLTVPAAAVHLYPEEFGSGRKLSHVIALGSDIDEALNLAQRCAAMLGSRP